MELNVNEQRREYRKRPIELGEKSLKFKTQWVKCHMRVEEKISKYEERTK